MQNKVNSINVTVATHVVETICIDMKDFYVDPTAELHLELATPDGRFHKVSVKQEWFIQQTFKDGEW